MGSMGYGEEKSLEEIANADTSEKTETVEKTEADEKCETSSEKGQCCGCCKSKTSDEEAK